MSTSKNTKSSASSGETKKQCLTGKEMKRGSNTVTKRKHPKCTKDKLCQTLRERIRPKPPGFVSLMYLNLAAKVNEKGSLREVIVYKRDAEDKGLVCNVCPWCGESLLPYMKLTEDGDVIEEKPYKCKKTPSRAASKKSKK